MGDRKDSIRRYLAVWSGDAAVTELDTLMTPNYAGHLGSRDRNLAGLKRDIADYRRTAPNVRFAVEHQFGDGDHVAARVTAVGTDDSGRPISARGLNISRWEGDRLAEEWAVWEPLH